MVIALTLNANVSTLADCGREISLMKQFVAIVLFLVNVVWNRVIDKQKLFERVGNILFFLWQLKCGLKPKYVIIIEVKSSTDDKIYLPH